jgi:hypothetical protein
VHPQPGADRNWLILNVLVYLTDFQNRRKRPKTAKDSQKVAGEKHETLPFTMPALILGEWAAKIAAC